MVLRFALFQDELPAVGSDDFPSQAEAESGALDFTTSGFVHAVEAIEDSGALFRGYRAPTVLNRQERVAA
jgi:hypothetical protein